MKKPRKSIRELVEGEGLRKAGPVMGIDVHKDVLQYCIVSQKHILEERELENNKKNLKYLLKRIHERKVGSVAMESTSQYHVKVMYYLLDKEVNTLMANPLQTKQTQGKKTDKLDARRIAIAHRDGRLKPSVIPHYDIWMLRKAMRKLGTLKDEATKCKQRLTQLFHQKEFNGKKLLKSNTGLELLSLLSTRTISEELIMNTINRSTRRKLILTENEIHELHKFQESLKPMERITFGTEISQIRVNKLLQEQQQLIYIEFAKNNEEFRKHMELLLSIPGVGPDTAAIVLAEIADISYFDNPSSLVKWAGLAPRVFQSGHKKNITGRIHKGGNKHLRRALVLSAKNIYDRTKSNPLHMLMREKKAVKEARTGKKAYWYALCIGGRKLLVSIYYMLKNHCRWNSIEVPKEVVERVQKHLDGKIRKFQKQLKELNTARQIISRDLDVIIRGIQVPDISPKYLLRQILHRPPISYNI